MLLIITNQHDLASDYLILRLRERGIDFKRFNTEQLGSSVSVEISFSNVQYGFRIEFEDGTVLTRESVSAVYFRQPLPPDYSGRVADKEIPFVNSEMIELLRSLWRLIPEKLWLNHPTRLWIASNKANQLLAASKIGLRIPRTLFSADRTSITDFFQNEENGVVGKAIRHGFIMQSNHMILAGTQRMPASFPSRIEDFASVPMTFQQEIKKTYDLRVVVVDNHIFATSIISPDLKKHVDWRLADITGRKLKYSKVKLPQDAVNKCKALVKGFGLRYSSIDMVQEDTGNLYFLELNPNGQWAWIEQLTQYPIRDSIIDALTRKGA
jgi:glutathione synthase/RimK-type ligase-like ATP-grasp enzyme